METRASFSQESCLRRRLWLIIGRHSLVMRQFSSITALLAVALTAGCVSFPGASPVSGKFVHRETGTYAVFQDRGRFYYSFRTDTPALDRHGLPRRLGFYDFAGAANTTPHLALNSFDAGRFTIRFSESRDRFYLSYPAQFLGERVYERVSDR